MIIRHRCNTLSDLQATPPELGVEIDLRSRDGELILAHDPFVTGERFADWLTAYRHRFLIVNVKEEGLERAVLARLAEHRIEAFFFLDQSFPFLLKSALAGERRCAVRVSEYESVETALRLAGRVDWVWVDTFTHLALTGEEAQRLQQAGLRLCLVSPELVGRSGSAPVAAMRAELTTRGIAIDAVCTKTPEAWAGAPFRGEETA
ncbi:PI-PLC domain-containing protein [Endothiovibrio diazotrophicus]